MNHLDLFSGYGGFTIPASKYGIKTIGFSEIDKYACSVLNYHYPNIKNYGDITKIKGEDLPAVDIITGGSPCQDLSVAGKGAGLNGARSGLFFHFIRLIKEIQPTYFVWENVKGAFSSQRGWDFARVQIEMEQAGYDVFWQLINAKDFGVPQNRERIFAIGIRKGGRREILFEQRESRQNTNKIVDTGHDGTNIFGTDGIAPTQKALGGGQGAKTGLYMMGMVDVTVKKRSYDTPVEINEYLRKHRTQTIGDIAKSLGLPKTQVEHYFRTDSSRAIPSPDVWVRLKELLQLDDTYDKQVTDFYEKEMEFESSRRVYDSKGVAKTTDTSGTGLYAVASRNRGNGKQAEFNSSGNANSITSVQTDSMVAIPNSNGNVHALDSNYWKGSNNPNKSRRSQIAEVKAIKYGQNNADRNGNTSDEMFTLKSGSSHAGVLQDMRIRRLTPTECERLMGLEDCWTSKGIIDGKEVDISDTQRYKMCGNGVVVNCVDYIYSLLFNETNMEMEAEKREGQLSLIEDSHG